MALLSLKNGYTRMVQKGKYCSNIIFKDRENASGLVKTRGHQKAGKTPAFLLILPYVRPGVMNDSGENEH